MFGLSDGSFWEADGSIVEHCFPATKTAVEYRPNVFGGFLNACWGTSSNDMYFVGNSGLILHFDGTNWTKLTTGTIKDLRSISGTSDKNIWACGYKSSTQQSVIVHYDGASWTEDSLSKIPIAQTGGYSSIWSKDSAGHSVELVSGSLVWRKTDNGPWRSDS